ncbi:MAG: hypothetical protein COU07_01250 [Candidatus Harrisonbacteria bacterium CG10_big_fil_rev_8_21_14_0_10_40_38]|uniref:DUF1648 domain-containing protein n=1 Tax=Candidatus Harrisonbacteria bacterium CG10_big_fil_rev_8_21_14_0_10_40_38 TaxID=1974583 RepID=A0A2H0USV8_9BACT|nr:MAG: hypothetical protein COU07_01250 [Candidatus Harrisonbacteria bacterium CG10_big_fil_rev_8_21_14_0_10_40_38]
MKKGQALIFLVFFVSIALGVFSYPFLPDRVVSHWNASDVPDDTMSKTALVMLFPVIFLVLIGVYFLILKIDPLRENIALFREYFDAFWSLVSLFLFYTYLLVVVWNLGYEFPIGLFMIPAISILFYAIGILLSKSKRNWFIGIRTPWTLSNDFVWEKTHVLGGNLFRAAAVISLLGVFFKDGKASFVILISLIVAIVITTAVYSYLVYRRMVGNKVI